MNRIAILRHLLLSPIYASVQYVLPSLLGALDNPLAFKGVLFYGEPGTGKTTLAKTACKYIKIVSNVDSLFFTAKEISQNADPNRPLQVNFLNSVKDARVLVIDDLGNDPDRILVFGSPVKPIHDVFFTRHNKSARFTFITTNLTTDQIKARYGDKIADRLNDDYLCLLFDNSSMR